MMSDIIVGVQRTLTDIGPLAKWNKKRLRWVITHNCPNYTRQHVIDLQMVIVSSQRVVIVDDLVKLRNFVSFGFKQNFQISYKLQGRIQQDGLTFQLFVNGQSYTELSKKSYGYQPPKLEISFEPPQDSFYTLNTSNNKVNNNPFMNIKQKNATVEIKKQIKPSQNSQIKVNKNVTVQQPQKLQEALKSTQDEVMRIMIEEKKRKKELQAMQKQLNST